MQYSNSHGDKSNMKAIGIFQGKQKTYNLQVLTILFDNGPLSDWQITRKMHDAKRFSLHPTIFKRLKDLEKKGYVRREHRLWFLKFKGIIAVLLIQRKPKPWSDNWNAMFAELTKSIEKNAEELTAKWKIKNVVPFLKQCGLYLDDFEAWVNLSKAVKDLMDKGVINFDVIKEKTLLGIILMEYTTAVEQLEMLYPGDADL